MPGTSAGMRKAWETRRAKYGPSGKASGQTVTRSSTGTKTATSGSGASAKSSTAKSSRNTNRATRVNGVRDLPYNADLDRAKHEREEVLAAIRAFDRAKSRGKFPVKVDRKGPYRHDQPPAWAIEQANHLRAEEHRQNVKRLRELDDYIGRMTDWLVAQERKKYGRRYH